MVGARAGTVGVEAMAAAMVASSEERVVGRVGGAAPAEATFAGSRAGSWPGSRAGSGQ